MEKMKISMDDKHILIKQSEEEYDELVDDILNTETIEEDDSKRNSIKTDWLNKKMSHHNTKRKLKKKKRIN